MNADSQDLGPGAPGLDRLLSLLAAGPTPAELARQNAALAMFRQNVRPVPARRLAARRLAARRLAARRLAARRLAARRPGLITRRAQFAVAAVALVIGFAAAAYAAALPAPVQHVAYRVLGFAGVPDARARPGRRPRAGRP